MEHFPGRNKTYGGNSSFEGTIAPKMPKLVGNGRPISTLPETNIFAPENGWLED